MVHFVTALSGLFAMALVRASGIRVETSATASKVSASNQQYRLKTHVIGVLCPDKDNLYVSAYHTGAGLNDAVLVPDVGAAVKGSLNASYQIFDIGSPYPFGIMLGSDTNYAAWELVTINGGKGSPGFFFDGAGLQWNGATFAGWLACDWWHGIPQLFWKYSYYKYPLPSSCVNVQLLPVSI